MLFLWRMFRQRSGSSRLLLKKYVKSIFFPHVRSSHFCVESAHPLLDADAATAEFQLKSVQKQSVKLLVFSCSSKVMQCHIYTHTTESAIYYSVFSFKKGPHGALPCCESRRKKNGAFKASVCCVPALVAFHPAQIRKSVRVPR